LDSRWSIWDSGQLSQDCRTIVCKLNEGNSRSARYPRISPSIRERLILPQLFPGETKKSAMMVASNFEFKYRFWLFGIFI
jgi:hypothetical protein